MARTKSQNSISLDVELNDINPEQVKKIKQDLASQFRSIEADPKWTETQKKIVNLETQKKKLVQERSAIEQKVASLDERRTKNYNDAQAHLAKINKLEMKREGITGKQEKQEKARDKISQQLVDLNNKSNKFATEETRILEERSKLKADEKTKSSEIASITASQKNAEREMLKIQDDRLATQEAIAQTLMKQNPEMSHRAALDQAKKLLPFSKKQSAFEKKSFELLGKTKKIRKDELARKLREIQLNKTFLKQQGVGFFERMKIAREQKRQAISDAGFGKKGKKGGAGGAAGAVAGAPAAVGGELMAVMKGLAGPLLALAGLATFIMLMIKTNKQVVEARKNIYKLGAVGSATFKAMGTDQEVTLGKVNAFRDGLYGLYDAVGMTYDEAQKGAEALAAAGLDLDLRTAATRKSFLGLMADAQRATFVLGESFDQVAGQAGELRTEFKAADNAVFGLLTTMKKDAVDASVMTSRFFSSVMNAAQGLAIYGTRLEDVSGAVGKLVNFMKGTRIGQKQALSIAESLINSNKTLTAQQKVVITQLGGAKDALTAERDVLAKNVKLTDDQKKRLESLNKVLSTEYPDSLEAGVRYFEALDPGKQVEVRMKALAKAASPFFKGLDIAKAGDLAQALDKNRQKIIELAQSVGFTEEDIRAIEEMAKAGKSVANLPAELASKLTMAQEKQRKSQATQQANIIAQGTKSISDILGQKIAVIINEIYEFLESTLGPFIAAAWKWMFKGDAEKAAAAAGLRKDIQKLEQDQAADNAALQELAKKKRTAKEEKQYQTLGGNVARRNVQIQMLKGGQEYLEKGPQVGVGRGLLEKAAGTLFGVKTTTERQAEMANAPRGQVKLMNLQNAFNEAGFANDDTKALANEMIRFYSRPDLAARIGKGEDMKFVDYLKHQSISDPESPGQATYRAPFPTADWQAVAKIVKDVLEKPESVAENYQKGGYTGNLPLAQTAGVVHGREFVFDSESTQKAGPSNLQRLMTAIKANQLDRPMSNFDAIRTNTSGVLDKMQTNQISDAFAYSAKSLVSAMDRLSTRMSTATAAGRTKMNNNVTININQRDRQEIEQIVYKVLYDQTGSGITG